MTQAGDLGHVTEHNSTAAAINNELRRFGHAGHLDEHLVIGGPNHIGIHNEYRAALELLASTAGQTFTIPLPPVRHLGDTGHIADHHAIESAILDANVWPAWNAATGGTVTEVANYNGTGEKWRVHRFTGSGTLEVLQAAQPFRILVVGGGGAGGGADGARHSQGGEGGHWNGATATATLSAGSHAVTVGNGGAPVSWGYAGSRGGSGGTSSVGAISAPGGLGGYFPSHGEGGPTNGGNSDISGAVAHYGAGGQGIWSVTNPPANSGDGGYAGYTNAGGGAGSVRQGGPGASGVVIVAYRIG